jgi:hypothetical protein
MKAGIYKRKKGEIQRATIKSYWFALLLANVFRNVRKLVD